MNKIDHRAWVRVIAAFVALLGCAPFMQPGLAAPGDSPLEAYFLPHGTELKGTIGAEYTSDYYYVIVPATGRLVVRLYDITLQDAGDELHVSLLQTSQNSVGTGYTTYVSYVAESRNDAAMPEVIDIPDLPRGVYFVKVGPERSYGWDGAEYKIKSTFAVFPPVVTDDVGDKKEYALPIVNQLPMNCRLSGNKDVDYFECHVPYNTDLTLSVTGVGAGGNVDMEVYTAWGVSIGSATRVGSADELLYLPDLVPGQYFIKVYGEGTAEYIFTATQEFTEASDIRDDVGDDLAHAMPLLLGNPSIFCLQPFDTDSDVFSVYQPRDGTLTVDVYNMRFWDGGEDLYVRVLDEYGNVMAESDNDRLVAEHIEAGLSRGQYFIAVHGQRSYGFDGAIYTLRVDTAARDVGDAFNEAMTIHAIPYGSETYGYPYIGMIDSPNDVDFFQVVLKDEGFVYVEVDRMLQSNVDVELFDGSYALLQTSANPGTQPEAIYVDGLDAGIYFIRVHSSDGIVGQYRLTPTIGTPTSPISDDIGDDTSTALPLVPYRRVNGYIWSDNTSDYFKFTSNAPNSWARVCVRDQHVWDGGEDVKLYVYNALGTQIGFSDNDIREDEYVELKGLAPGTYYARVVPERSYEMSPVQYTLLVETEVAPLPSAELRIPANIQGRPGEIVYAPVALDNPHPDDITSMSVGVQFDPSILEPMGVSNTGLTAGQGNAQVHYARSTNTISASMDNFSTIQSGDILSLIFRIRPGVPAGSSSPLTILVATLDGAVVPATDGLVTVTGQ